MLLVVPLDEFIEEMEMELSSFEGMEEEEIYVFKKSFAAWMLSKDGLKEMGENPVAISFENENHLFDTAALYVISVIENETDAFWQGFSSR